MGDKSKIEWTDATWNPLAGCSIVSKGCTNCYAMKVAARLAKIETSKHKYLPTVKHVNGKPVWTGHITLDKNALPQPLRWKKPRMIFVNSMSDLFHENAQDEWIDKIFAIMALCPQHIFQVLTKRPQRMRDYLRDLERRAAENECDTAADYLLAHCIRDEDWPKARESFPTYPLPNVWLGVSVEDQTTANERIPQLLQTPAAIRFISAEPLLGAINLNDIDVGDGSFDALTAFTWGDIWEAGWKDSGTEDPEEDFLDWHDLDEMPDMAKKTYEALDWVICGGESGPDARPMHPDWPRSLRDQCAAAGTPFFFKQWGEWGPDDLSSEHQEHYEIKGEWDGQCRRMGKKKAGNHLDGRQHLEIPERGAA